MLFNSFDFAIFLPIIFILYWFGTKGNLGIQNLLLLAASYFFYGYWDYRFLFLLMFSTLLDYFTGIKMSEATSIRTKRFWFWLSICVNLGFLGVFKYYNFFVSSFADVLSVAGFKPNIWTLEIILPVGISFYTFHGLSYVIDIYNNRIRPERNLIVYSLFVSYFPLLVAGPIERATHLLPQITKKREFDYFQAVGGLRLILWGLFKKVVIADNCALFVNDIFANYQAFSGLELIAGVIFFAFQIYGDFSGYSDIALGTSRLFGIELLRNFAFPYFSRDIAEFWRRWHMSLTSWFRDYLYIPLGGSKGGDMAKVRNTFIVFLVSGLWHGANWTFIAWGLLNAIYFLPLLLRGTNRNNLDTVAESRLLPNIKEVFQMASTFAITCFAWIFFRAPTLTDAIQFITSIFGNNFIDNSFETEHMTWFDMVITCSNILILLIVEWVVRIDGFAKVYELRPMARNVLYFCTAALIFLFGKFGSQEFIYFQF